MDRWIAVGTLMFAIAAMAIGAWGPWPLANPDAAFSLGVGASIFPVLTIAWRLFDNRPTGRGE